MNRLALSLEPRQRSELLRSLRDIPQEAAFVEIHLDRLKPLPEVAPLVALATVPLVVTCRPRREGGGYSGDERCRVEILRRAQDAGARWTDVEWDAVHCFSGDGVLASRHWYSRFPRDLEAHHRSLASRAEGVKVAAVARSVHDVAALLEVLGRAKSPTIGIAMGRLGAITRALAPCFESALLTYASWDDDSTTGPGQSSIGDLVRLYCLDRVGPHTRVRLHVGSCPGEEVIAAANGANPGVYLHLATTREMVAAIVPVLCQHLPDVQVAEGW